MDAISLSILLKTSNIDATIKFYVEMLDFTCAARMPNDNPEVYSILTGGASFRSKIVTAIA